MHGIAWRTLRSFPDAEPRTHFMRKFASSLLVAALMASVPVAARDSAQQRSLKVAHNQAKAQQKAMNKAAKAQRKELKKAHKRANS